MNVFTFTPSGSSIEDAYSQDPTIRAVPGPRAMQIELLAVAVNPLETKVPIATGTKESKILGWGAAGIVRQVGPEVTLFQPGDEVFYSFAGTIAAPGGYSRFHCVDERVVGYKPHSLSAAEAAALPLYCVNAWELLFDRLGVAQDSAQGECLLIMGEAAGTGAMLVQLARQLTRLTVIATASCQDKAERLRQLGAHHVIDPGQPLGAQLQAFEIADVSHVASLANTNEHFLQLIEILRPQGRLGVIDDPGHLDATALKTKSLSLHWEMMFTRSLFETTDMINQHHLLNRIASLIDQGVLLPGANERGSAADTSAMSRTRALLDGFKAKNGRDSQGR
ncbi:zinc-binding alcohol dehydrogenase family protein [Pseudomonas sp. NPDC087598]|uniref:zinc-binding alcohol dehydrogenase family protein n=1 Tax=Pseudomonas sp. NPDC087598 TaxID=3364440 RepID=UPI00382F2478